MPSRFFRDLSASTIQVLLTQLAGLAVFLLTSFYLPKEDYGELNWSLAVFTFATAVLSLRLEQVLVKKAATQEDITGTMTIFLLHVTGTSLLCWIFFFIMGLFAESFFSVHALLLMIGISQLLSFISLPFKQVANGKEQFGLLAIMSATANLVRALGLVLLLLFSAFTLTNVVWVFILGSVSELLLSYWLVTIRMKIPLSRQISFSAYKALLKESVPQIGTAFLMAGITRMDWILLGIFSSSVFTAEYSFAYRVFELSPVPLLIIAPILLSRFSRFFGKNPGQELPASPEHLHRLIRVEMILAGLIPLLINLIWVPVLDPLTHGKYGSSNALVFLILSAATPFLYISNLIWTIDFAKGRWKRIFRIIACTFFIILAGDLIFIPLYGTTGAAAVYLFAMITEYLNYMRGSAISAIRTSWLSLLICCGSALISGLSVYCFIASVSWRVPIAIIIYFILLLATRQYRKSDINGLTGLFSGRHSS